MKAGSVRRALQELIKVQPTLSFSDTIVEAVGWKQKDVEATVVVTKRCEPLPSKEEALAPSALLAGKNLASMKQEVSTFKQELAHLSNGDNLLWRDPDEDWKC